MKKVKIYTKNYCPYCTKAKRLLESLNIAYQEIDLTEDPDLASEIFSKTGFRTVPQIFIGDGCIGGCDQLFELHSQGKLLTEIQS